MNDLRVVHKSVGVASSCPQRKGIFAIYRGEKGITLIALIVTIIVLLILAMTTVGLVLRNNLIEKAQLAKDEYEQAAQAELDALDKLESAMGSITDDDNTDDEIPDNFKKYILGQDETGRPISEIFSSETGFIDDENTEENENETLELLSMDLDLNYNEFFMFIKYDNKAYRAMINVEGNTTTLELIYVPNGKEGEKTEDGWIILYDNGETAEAVSPTAMGNLTLGYSETATTDEQKITEAIDSYNNAIGTINTYCKNLEGLPSNKGVRSVGSAIEISSDPTNMYTSENLIRLNSAYDKRGKRGDNSYLQDLIRMEYWGMRTVETQYWIASRYVNDSVKTGISFGIYSLGGYTTGTFRLWSVNSTGEVIPYSKTYAVRPIITIDNID